MPKRAKLYINSTIVLGLVILSGCLLFNRQFSDPPRFFGYLFLACLASTLKIKLPKIQGTMSVNFLFVLIGIAELSVAESITLSWLAALIQCFWKPLTRPAGVQVLFNMATMVVANALSFALSHAFASAENLLVSLALAVCAYFVLNTGMIAMVLSLTGERTFVQVWRQCYLWSFPYYLIGAVLAGAIVFSNRAVGWKPSLMILPMMYLVYSYYRLYLLQISVDATASASRT